MCIRDRYGVTNFFRVHRERFISGAFEITDCKIIKMFLVNVFHVVLKGGALSIFILTWENAIVTGAKWWFVFNMMPSSIISILANLYTAYKIENEKRSSRSVSKFLVSINQTFSLFLKTPQILIIPALTPYVIVKGKENSQLELSSSMTVLNRFLTLFTVLFTLILLISLMSISLPFTFILIAAGTIVICLIG